MAKYIMALDAGTTSNRCILFNEHGEMCSVSQREFTQFFPKPGWVEHDANEIWATQLGVAVEAMQKIGATAADIAAIGAWMQGAPRYFLQCFVDSGALISPGFHAPDRADLEKMLQAARPFFGETTLRGVD